MAVVVVVVVVVVVCVCVCVSLSVSVSLYQLFNLFVLLPFHQCFTLISAVSNLVISSFVDPSSLHYTTLHVVIISVHLKIDYTIEKAYQNHFIT